MKKRKYEIIKGDKKGRLTFIEEFYKFEHNRKTRYVKCLCNCGKTTEQKVVDVFTTVQSCGCLRSENTTKRFITHGKSNLPLYKVFIRMKTRCFDKTSKDYPYYGERGITIYQEWIDHPESFLIWAENNGYKKGLTIERIDNNLNYIPSNCTFISRARQVNNMRSNIIIDYQNEKMSMADFCRKHNLRYQRFHDRIIRLDWTVEKAILDCN